MTIAAKSLLGNRFQMAAKSLATVTYTRLGDRLQQRRMTYGTRMYTPLSQIDFTILRYYRNDNKIIVTLRCRLFSNGYIL